MGGFGEETYRNRQRDVLALAREQIDIDVLLVSDPVGVRYLCGLTEGSRDLLIDNGGAVLLASEMFRERAEEECRAVDVRNVVPPFAGAVLEEAKRRGWNSIGLIDRCTSMAAWKQLAETVGEKNLKMTGDVVLERRSVKDAREIALIAEAVEIAEEAFLELIENGAGYFMERTERELALELEMLMRTSGADDQAFPNGIILASGSNAFGCHHVPGDRTIEEGDVVLVDWGAVVEGYRSDLTRMIGIRSVPGRIIEIHGTVRRALEAAKAAIRPGVMSHEIDRIARDLIAKEGYGENDFRHGLGHGIGLEVHESPRFVKDPDSEFNRPLKAGMVMTVEPGIYLKGVGGVRLENDVLVTEDGCDDFSSLDLDLEIVILE